MGYISTIRQSYHSLITTNLSYNLIVQTLQAFVSEHGEPWSSHERPIPTLLAWDGPLPLSVSPLNPSEWPTTHASEPSESNEIEEEEKSIRIVHSPCQRSMKVQFGPLKSTRIHRNTPIPPLNTPIR